jgi:hypothetical protein
MHPMRSYLSIDHDINMVLRPFVMVFRIYRMYRYAGLLLHDDTSNMHALLK